MKGLVCWISVLIATIFLATTAGAQSQRWELGAGAGFNFSTGRAGNDLNTGGDIGIRAGYKPARQVALDLDFNYNRWNLNNAALARYGEPGGYTTIWSIGFTPEIRGPVHWRVDPYVFGGPGLYYRNLSLTVPTVVNTVICDFFFGYCFPATVGVNQVVASSTTYKMGFNGGMGLEYRIGDGPWRIFSEARYSRMFTTNGSDLVFIPVTFGVRW
jgi:hypothetical protein